MREMRPVGTPVAAGDVALADVLADDLVGPGAAPLVRRRKKLGIVFWLAVAFLVLLTLAAIFARVLPLKSPDRTYPAFAKHGPSAQFWFGNDSNGRDI